jgi:predicted enzyme related to lactoylglutathione lyase
MARVTHFEIHASRPQALIDFYGALFDWKFHGGPDYWQIDTGAGDPPGLNGGLIPRRGPAALDGQAVNAFICTIDVEALDGSLAKALSLGASLALPKMTVPGVGWLAYVKDPDANLLGLMQRDASV